ncbi:S8 family serine peptidase [Luteibacter sp. CQ10]|uniref:S8 family serine peptidase n=1 Tax=Luteibacter sp. CQ10 TaxID=2805821 RepID=UPI0034A2EA9B
MHRSVSFPLFLGLLACSLTSHAATRYIVRFAEGYAPSPTPHSPRARRSAPGPMRMIRRLATGDALFELHGATAESLAALPGVLRVEEDRRLYPMAVSDPLWKRQWYLHHPRYGVDAEVAWKYTRGADAVVAVLDTGIVPHAEFDGRLLPGYDFLSDAEEARDGDGRDDDPTDEGDWIEPGQCVGALARKSSWHGTHVAGLALAAANNREGIAGVAPEAMLLPVRVLGRCGAWESDVIDAITWASGGSVPGVAPPERRADVINLSLGGISACGASMADAIDGARRRGTAVVAAGGNEGIKASASSPANCPGVISVGALAHDGAQAWYSNHGDGLTLSAPGGSGSGVQANDILSTVDSGDRQRLRAAFGYASGTSMAAPLVAGLVALMRSVDPDITVDEIARQLVDNARPLQGRCPKGCGAGVMDAGATVDAVAEDLARRNEVR